MKKSDDSNGLDSYCDLGSIAVIGGDRSDLVNNLHAGNYLTESGILTVEVGCVLMHDEELAGCRVGVICSRHGDNTSLVLDGVSEAVSAEFAVELLVRAAHTVAEGVAALDHKAGDDSVEGESVVEAFLYERFEVSDGLGCVLGIELELDLAAVFHFNDYHIFFPFVF